MNFTLSNIIVFSVGAAIGAVLAWKLTKEKYEKLANADIAAAHEQYKREATKYEKPEFRTKEIEQYTDLTERLGYSQEIAEKGETTPETVKDQFSPIHIIDPLTMNDDTDLDVEYCTLYANDILTDREDNVMDIETTIGLEALEHIGEYDRDMVYVRNDDTRTYYEVLRVDIMYDPE